MSRYARTGHPLAERPCTAREMWACGVAAIQVPHGCMSVTDLPPLFSETGVVSLRGRSPSPMARLAIELILEVARDPHAQP